MSSQPNLVVRSAFIKVASDVAEKFAKYSKTKTSAATYLKLRGLSTRSSGYRLDPQKAAIMDHLREVFTRDPIWPSRFSRNFNALYGSRAVRTANEERRHISKGFFDSKKFKSAIYHVISVEVYGDTLDFHSRTGESRVPADWNLCQTFQQKFSHEEHTKILFRSLRGNVAGLNYCCLREEECLPEKIIGRYKFESNGSKIRYKRV